MSETTESKTGVQPATTETRATGRDTTSGSRSSSSSSEQTGSKRGKKVYDNVSNEPKSPNSKADARGPVTKVKDGNGDETKIYPGMTVGYAQGPGRELYDEGMYSSDQHNAYYERRSQDGVDLPG